MFIIGITGTIGAGKGTIVEYLVNKKNFKHYSVRSFLLHEIKKQNLEPNRDSMVIVANRLREEHTPSYIVDELIKKALHNNGNAVIESIRAEGEVLALRRHTGFYLFSVDADPLLRYQRITLRNSETDHIDYQTFINNENREIDTNDPNKQNLKRCIELADFTLTNNGTIEELHVQIENIFKYLQHKE